MIFVLNRVTQDPFWGASESGGLDSVVGRYRKGDVVVLVMIVEWNFAQLRTVQEELWHSLV